MSNAARNWTVEGAGVLLKNLTEGQALNLLKYYKGHLGRRAFLVSAHNPQMTDCTQWVNAADLG